MRKSLSRFLVCVLLLTGILWQSRAADFAVYDIYVDSKQPLAAYQVRIQAKNLDAKIISVEGGEHPAFKEPPFYDPKAIQKNVIKLAAFSGGLRNELPVGRTRIASLHVQVEKGSPEFSLQVEAAATVGGKKIKINPAIERRGKEEGLSGKPVGLDR